MKLDDVFSVKCDSTTMTQKDIDTGRLNGYIGIDPVKPAEFVIFRIGQKTVEATARCLVSESNRKTFRGYG